MSAAIKSVLFSCVLTVVTFHHNVAQVPIRRGTQFHVEFEWNVPNFTWPSQYDYTQALTNGSYIPENNLITGIKSFNNLLFVSVPRWRYGVPATLAAIPAPNRTRSTAPLLEPFPSWEANRLGNCRALQNVQSIEVDTNGVLWVIDGGRTATMEEQSDNSCPPKLVLYDLHRNAALIREYVFPNDVALHNENFLNDLVIDEFGGRYAYITDNSGIDPGLIVYSLSENTAWKVREPTSMMASRDASDFTVNGTRVSAAIPIDGIALAPVSRGPDRDLYYSPVSSYHIYAISSAVLRDRNLATSRTVARHIRDLGEKPSQSDGMIMDERGFLYYGMLAENAIAEWDSSQPFMTGQRYIARDSTYLQWPDSFAIDDVGNLYVISNRIQNVLARRVNIREPNYRILAAYIGARSYLYGENIPQQPFPSSSPFAPMPSQDYSSIFSSTPMYSQHQGRSYTPQQYPGIYPNSEQGRLYPTIPVTDNQGLIYNPSTPPYFQSTNTPSYTARSTGIPEGTVGPGNDYNSYRYSAATTSRTNVALAVCIVIACLTV